MLTKMLEMTVDNIDTVIVRSHTIVTSIDGALVPNQHICYNFGIRVNMNWFETKTCTRPNTVYYPSMRTLIQRLASIFSRADDVMWADRQRRTWPYSQKQKKKHRLMNAITSTLRILFVKDEARGTSEWDWELYAKVMIIKITHLAFAPEYKTRI